MRLLLKGSCHREAGHEGRLGYTTHSMLCDRIRLRKKTWRSPGTVYTDQQVFERDIHVFANCELFVEPLEGQWTLRVGIGKVWSMWG